LLSTGETPVPPNFIGKRLINCISVKGIRQIWHRKPKTEDRKPLQIMPHFLARSWYGGGNSGVKFWYTVMG